MARKVNYSVTNGLNGGYLPDTVTYCATLQDAYDMALWYKRDWQDAGNIVKGNIRKDRYYAIFHPGKSYADNIIEIHDLSNEGLLIDEDGRISDDNGKTWQYVN